MLLAEGGVKGCGFCGYADNRAPGCGAETHPSPSLPSLPSPSAWTLEGSTRCSTKQDGGGAENQHHRGGQGAEDSERRAFRKLTTQDRLRSIHPRANRRCRGVSRPNVSSCLVLDANLNKKCLP